MPTFSRSLEQSLHRALALANERHHEYATLEHLLLALIDDQDASAVMRACNVDLDKLRRSLTAYLESELENLITDGAEDSKPTAGFQRVIQRAVLHVQNSGRDEVTGANVLVALFSERESHAVYFLQQQEMSRLDAVNYISHGIAKVPGLSERQPIHGADEDVVGDRVVRKGHEALDAYCVNLNEKAAKGRIDPLIGREAEVERTIQILCRRTKNNPLYVGEPGVGKTAIAEGLARRVVHGDVPEVLQGVTVYALDMGALAGQYSPDEIAVRAVEAGMDILLHPQDALATVDAVVAAVEQGRLTRQRIAESVARIMYAKTKLGLFESNGHVPARLEYEQHQMTARELGRKALHIMNGGRKGVLPVRPDAGVACFILDDDGNHETSNAFIREMKERFQHLSLLVLTPDNALPISLVKDSINVSGAVVMALYSRISASKGRSGISEKLRTMAADIIRTAETAKAKSVVISFDSPYILDLFKDAGVRIAAYDRMAEIQRAAAGLLAGE